MLKLFQVLFFSLMPIFSLANELNYAPLLRLNTTMHNDKIMGAAVNQNETKLLTASIDTTAKLWDIETGELLQTYRLPLLAGDFGGELFAAGFDAEERWVAISGTTGNLKSTFIYIINPDNGSIYKQLTIPSESIILTLCTSPDGSRLAAGGSMGTVAWTTEDWHEIGSDLNDGMDPTMDCLFTSKNELITVNEDRTLRLYDKDMSLKDMTDLEEDFPKLERGFPNKIALQKDGQNFAIGMNSQNSEVYLGTVDPMALTAKVDTEGMDKALNVVDWSADGNRLFAAGLFQSEGRHPVIGLNLNEQSPPSILSGDPSMIIDIFALNNNTLLTVGVDRSWMLQTVDGDVLLEHKPENINGATIECNAFQISPDARQVYIDSDSSFNTPLLIDLEQKRVRPANNAPDNLRSAKTDGLPITNWKGRYPKLNGNELALGLARKSNCLAIAENDQSFVLSTKNYLRKFRRDGFLTWAKRITSDHYAVNITADQRFIVALSKDGIIHWYNYADGEEVLAMFVDNNTLEWVVWTPDGYFDASENGAELIGWQINHGYLAPEFYTAQSLEAIFYDANIVPEIFDGSIHAKSKRVSINDYFKNINIEDNK